MKYFWIFCGIVLCSPPAMCDEPAEQFLQALRDQQYYNVALDYLEDMETSPLAPANFKESLPFERAQTLIQSAGRIRDTRLLEKRLLEAERLLTESEASTSNPELKAKSQTNRGDLLFQRAKIYLKAGSRPSLTAGEKETQNKQAREYLLKANQAFGGAKESYKKILDNYDLDPNDPDSKTRLKRTRGIFTVVRLKLPQIMEIFADTLEETDPQRKKFLGQAVSEFEKLWLKYPNFPAGLDSCLSAARCKYKLKEYEEALSFVQQIFSLPNNSALLPRKRQAMVLASDCWAAIRPYPYDDVIANLESFCSKLTRRDQRNPQWQRIQMELARAYHNKSVDLKKQDPSDGRIKSFSREAAKLIKAVARIPGEHRDTARKLVEEWGLNLAAESVAETKEPLNTFADAKARGIELITEIEGLNADISDAKRQANGPGSVSPAELDGMKKRLVDIARQCISVLERAIVLRETSTTREDLNQIRYLQSVCYFVQENYFESALIGEFLVEKYPRVAFSKQAGGIAVRSYAALHDQANPENRSFEQEQLAGLSAKMVETWPGSPESAEAASILTKLTLAKKDLSTDDIDKAEELMQTVSSSSIQRALLAVNLGRKLWFQYRKKKAEETESQDELKQRLTGAIKYLSEGVQGFSLNDLRMEAAWGAVRLVDAHLENGDLDRALESLESGSLAPIDLVKQKNKTIVQSGDFDRFASETYIVAGKTYLEALGQRVGDNQYADKALQIVKAMQIRANRIGSEKMKQDVSRMYRLIAVKLESQLSQMSDPDQRKAFVDRLGQFLGTLQTESNDANTIIWTGKTLMNLGDSFAEQNMEQQAKPLYRSAIEALNRASKMGIDDPKMQLELSRQQAVAKRGTGKFEESYKDLMELLKKNPNAWPIQMDAAKTLQAWGMKAKSAKFLAKAISGGERIQDPKTKRPKNLVWGWAKLAKAFEAKPKFKSAYYESLMGEVVSRLEYGRMEKNPKILQTALKRLQIAKSKNANLGDETWKPRFEKIESQIQSDIESTNVSAGN